MSLTYQNSLRLLTDFGGQCEYVFDCSGLLNCCHGLGEKVGYGLCYPKCDVPLGEPCSVYHRCDPSLICCNSICMEKSQLPDSCLTDQEIIDRQNEEI